MHSELYPFFEQVLINIFGTQSGFQKAQLVGGGDINESAVLICRQDKFFIKWNSFSSADLFKKEASGLSLLSKSGCIQTPKTIGLGTVGNRHFLILEYIEKGNISNIFWEHFGTQLAQMHRNSAEYFGLDHDNFIGRLPQINSQEQSWTDFFINHRLIPQIKVGLANKTLSASISAQFERLFTKLHQLIPPAIPSLLHGDLWGGNFMCGSDGKAWIYDPAVYYGHREMEIAFTNMFGGFDHKFYEAYLEAWPLEAEFDDRIDLYNLYPLLVHANLFGGSYVSSITHTLKRYI